MLLRLYIYIYIERERERERERVPAEVLGVPAEVLFAFPCTTWRTSKTRERLSLKMAMVSDLSQRAVPCNEQYIKILKEHIQRIEKTRACNFS